MNDRICKSDIWSWSVFSDNAVDPYWIQCTLIGNHTEHENSETGVKWRCEQLPSVEETKQLVKEEADLVYLSRQLVNAVHAVKADIEKHHPGVDPYIVKDMHGAYILLPAVTALVNSALAEKYTKSVDE